MDTKQTHLLTQIEKVIEGEGADFFGVADLTPAQAFVADQGGAMVAQYPTAISIGIGLPHAIVDRLPQRKERAVAVSYRHHSYDVINARLDALTSRVSGMLQAEGYDALPVAASKRVDDERICALFSHKLAAHLAGLGWIGKSCLLVTPQMGPRVRWGTVLTDAPLEPTGQPMDERCGDCMQCVEICPAGAFTGRPFREDEDREARYEADKCDSYFFKMSQGSTSPAVCGLCLYVCPHGRRREETQ